MTCLKVISYQIVFFPSLSALSSSRSLADIKNDDDDDGEKTNKQIAGGGRIKNQLGYEDGKLPFSIIFNLFH